MFSLKSIILILLLNISLNYAITNNVVKGYFYNIFPKDISQDDIKNIIKSKFDEDWKNLNYTGNYTIDIKFSETKNFQDYIDHEVKTELFNNNEYDFFLIDINNLYKGREHYMKIIPQRKYEDSKKYFMVNNGMLLRYLTNLKINSKNNQGYIDSIFLNDCRLEDRGKKDKDLYYGLPFSTSYRFLYYNKYYVSNIANEIINENISWDDIEKIMSKILTNCKDPNFNCDSDVELMNISLNSDEKIASLYLEGLFSNSNLEYKECESIDNIKNSNNNKYFNFNRCNSNFEIFYNNKAESWLEKMRYLINNNYINKNCYEMEEDFSKNEFSQLLKSVFYLASSENYKYLQNKINFSKNTNSSRLLSDIIGTHLLPGDYSTYNTYVIVGSRNLNKEDENEVISNVIEVLTSESAQIDRAIKFGLTPAFDFNLYDKTDICSQNIPCDLLKKIKPISLTKTMYYEESASNFDIFDLISNYLKNNTQEFNQFKSRLKSYLKLTYIEYSSYTGKIALAYSVIGNLYAFTLIGIILYYKNKNPQLKKSSPMICVLFILGVTCTFYYPLFNVGIPSALSCGFNHYFMFIFLATAICCYLIKIWRIHYMLNSYKAKVFGIKLSDYSLSSIITAIITIELLLNIIWDFTSQRVVGSLLVEPVNKRFANCTSHLDNYFYGILILFNFII
eukprot:jgi/Orpsp1_1/1175506/evm.model.c7180000054130.1